MTLTITFQAPSRSGSPSEAVFHERHIHQVPASVVEEMVRDFGAYQSNGVGEDQRQVYRFQVEGKETVLALDFEEVSAVMAEES